MEAKIDRIDSEHAVRKWVEIGHDIWMHYDHACEKHPFFADDLCSHNPGFDWPHAATCQKAQIKAHVDRGETVTAHSVLMAEMYEIFGAYSDGDIARARYEVLDAIAVLLRMDDMLAKMQETQNG